MDAVQALADLTALSAQIERSAILGDDGVVSAATPPAAGDVLARAAVELLAGAPSAATPVASVEVGLASGSVFVVAEGSSVVIAVTGPEPPSALVLHDLRACLRRLGSQDGSGA